MMDAKLLRKLGTIEITDAFLTVDGIRQIGHIFLKFFPLSIKYDIARGLFTITGCSPELPELLEGETPPIVNCQLTSEHKEVIEAKLKPWVRNPSKKPDLEILDDLQAYFANERAGIK